MAFNKIRSLSFILFFSLWNIHFSALGQIILDENDFGNIGDAVELYSDPTYIGSQSAGQTGPGQIWTFNFFQPQLTDTLFFIDPANSPYAASFPNSNLALQQAVSYTFLNKSSSSILVNGFNLDLDTFFSNASISISPAIPMLVFPTNFGDNYNSAGGGIFTFPLMDTITIAGPPIYVDSVRVTFNVVQKDTVNGFGQLNIDTISTAALRIESWQTISFSIEALIELFPGTWIWFPIPIPIIPEMNLRSVNYFGKNKAYSLLRFDLDSAGDIISNSYQPVPGALGIFFNKNERLGSFMVYPNPTEKEIFLKPAFSGDLEVEIKNIEGKTVFNGKMKDPRIGLDVSFLEPGIYLLELLNQKGETNTIRFTKK